MERGELIFQKWSSKRWTYGHSHRRHPGEKVGLVDLARAVEGGDAKVPCSVGIMTAVEQEAKKSPVRFQELTLVWCLQAPSREPRYPGVNGEGGTSEELLGFPVTLCCFWSLQKMV